MEGGIAGQEEDARCGGGKGPSATKKCSEVLKIGAAVPMVGTCEGYECNFQHNAPNKGVSSQDGGRLGERARARAQING